MTKINGLFQITWYLLLVHTWLIKFYVCGDQFEQG